ncbi:unnamed protein product, partial [Rotaria magnacalcarata]
SKRRKITVSFDIFVCGKYNTFVLYIRQDQVVNQFQSLLISLQHKKFRRYLREISINTLCVHNAFSN